MEIKHKPTHPLPWKATEDHGDPCLQAADGENIALSVPYDSFADKEAFPYIAHAANAYPKLIEALCGLSLRHMDGTICFDGCEKAGLVSPSPFCIRYQTLLSDLGEGP